MKRLTIYQRPILSEELEDKIDDAVQSFLHRGIWRDWGLDKIRDQGAAILLHGPAGTGKTITAYYLGRKLHLKVVEISMADYGSHIPGELARNIKKIFNGELILAKQENRQAPIILLDECDAMIVSRKKLGSDMMWMLEPINALLVEIGKWPGLVVLATNLAPILDEALERRLIAKVKFDKPDRLVRKKIWKAKWPAKFPCQPNNGDLDRLAEFDLTGAQIENVFLLWSSSCIRQGITPVVVELIEFVQKRWGGYFEA
jgi:SpoVK/Ycf46/Vps4 family AAA+-type ATPase